MWVINLKSSRREHHESLAGVYQLLDDKLAQDGGDLEAYVDAFSGEVASTWQPNPQAIAGSVTALGSLYGMSSLAMASAVTAKMLAVTALQYALIPYVAASVLMRNWPMIRQIHQQTKAMTEEGVQ